MKRKAISVILVVVVVASVFLMFSAGCSGGSNSYSGSGPAGISGSAN